MHACPRYDFQARVAANELSMKRGQKLVLFVPRERVEAVRRGSDASLWQWARDAAGDEGWVPSNRLNVHASDPVTIRVGADGSDVIVSPELAELDYVMQVGQRRSADSVPKVFTYWCVVVVVLLPQWWWLDVVVRLLVLLLL